MRLVVGAVVCFVLPAGSLVRGSGMLAWTMYSRAGEFRIDLVAFDSAGRAHIRNATVLADGATLGAAALLAGSDHWRQGPSVAALRWHLDDLAAYACRDLNATSIEISLHERMGNGPERVTSSHLVCAR
ncbi:MAG: hypothetical protein ACLP1X_30530 [Polyangiaceae bacterium]|jgi:hypothetical protein